MSITPPYPPNPGFNPATPLKPKNWLTENIVATVVGLFCCCGVNAITGVIGIVFSTQVDTKYNAGDYAGAESSANTAKIMFYVTAGLVALGVILNIISFFLYGGLMFKQMQDNYNYSM